MNSEQIKIIAVVVVTLFFAILFDSRNTSIKNSVKINNLLSQAGKPSTKPSSSKPSCNKNGIRLYGKVQFVDSFPDLKIQYVSSFPDIKVEFVSSFPSSCGKWQEVTSFPDFKVQVVSSFPDLKVQKVSSFPGMN